MICIVMYNLHYINDVNKAYELNTCGYRQAVSVSAVNNSTLGCCNYDRDGGGGLRQLIRCHPCPVKSGDPRCSHTHNAGRYISICRRPRPAQHSASEGGVQRTVLSAPNYSATTIIPPPPTLSHSLHRVIDYSSSRRSPSVCLFDGSVTPRCFIVARFILF